MENILTKSFLIRKFKHSIYLDEKKTKSEAFEMLLVLNKVDRNKDMSKLIQLAAKMNFNVEEYSNLLKDENYIIFNNEWNAYESLDLFFQLLLPFRYKFDYNKFSQKFIIYNANAIIDNMFKTSNKYECKLKHLLEETQKLYQYELKRYLRLEEEILNDFLLNTYLYINDKFEKIFKDKYLITYDKSKQLEAIENTSEYLSNNIESGNIEFDSTGILILEEEFKVNNLEERILKKIKTSESSSIYNEIIMTISENFDKFKSIIEFDIVEVDNNLLYLKNLSKVLLDNYIRFCYVDVLKSFKSNKADRVKQVLVKYRLRTEDLSLLYLEQLIDLNSKRKIPYIIELYYKQFGFENFKNDIIKIHNYMNMDTDALETNEQYVSDILALEEKQISYLSNIFLN